MTAECFQTKILASASAPALAIKGCEEWKATSWMASSCFFLWAVISCTHVLLSSIHRRTEQSWPTGGRGKGGGQRKGESRGNSLLGAKIPEECKVQDPLILSYNALHCHFNRDRRLYWGLLIIFVLSKTCIVLYRYRWGINNLFWLWIKCVEEKRVFFF